MIRLDVNGRLVSVERAALVRLRDIAARGASESSTVRDLSLVLEQAIRSGRVVALQRQEQRALAQILGTFESREDFAELREALHQVTIKPTD